MLLSDFHTPMAQEHRNILNRHSGLKQCSGKRIAESMVVAVFDLRILRYLSA